MSEEIVSDCNDYDRNMSPLNYQNIDVLHCTGDGYLLSVVLIDHIIGGPWEVTSVSKGVDN